jgi:hypothetical protein
LTDPNLNQNPAGTSPSPPRALARAPVRPFRAYSSSVSAPQIRPQSRRKCRLGMPPPEPRMPRFERSIRGEKRIRA